MIELTSLASGSKANSSLIKSGKNSVLVDMGVSYKNLREKLMEKNMEVSDLDGIFITHEHTDHVKGLGTLVKNSDVPIYAPKILAAKIKALFPLAEKQLIIMREDEEIEFSDMQMSFFRTSHDCEESVGYRADGDISVGVCTDLGVVTDEVAYALSGVKSAILESNHDVKMLRYGDYPFHLKKRVLSDRGHLSNVQAAEFSKYLSENGAESLILAHLSQNNNTETKARETVCEKVWGAGYETKLYVAPENKILSVEVF